MEIGINDLDFTEPEVDDNGQVTGNYVESGEEKPWMESSYPENLPDAGLGSDSEDNTYYGDDVITQLLRDKGISDPSRIKFADENDLIEERDWNTLTPEEQYNILATPNETYSDDLDESEAHLLSILRENQLSPDEFVNIIRQQAVSDYMQSLGGQEPVYEVDGISDDDLYMIDLAARTPDITDEELLNSLDAAKQNPDLFLKLMQGIRLEYKNLEEQNKAEQQAIASLQAQDRYQEFSNSIFDSIDLLSEIGGLDITLSDDDKEELAQFILGQDLAGLNHLSKALNDPQVLTLMAWFYLKGAETIDGVVDYFTKEITKVRNNSYLEGYNAAQNGQKPSVVITPPKKRTKGPGSLAGVINDVNDLDLYNE